MPQRRKVLSSASFSEKLADLCTDTAEQDKVIACIAQLQTDAEGGQPFVFSGETETHYVRRCGRFLIGYVFTADEVDLRFVRRASTV